MMSSSKDLQRLTENLRARTEELGRQIGESTASRDTTSNLLAKIAELRARNDRTSAVVSGRPADKPAR
jgi:hypothetical protein